MTVPIFGTHIHSTREEAGETVQQIEAESKIGLLDADASADVQQVEPAAARWRWSAERLTERIDVRFSQSTVMRIWRFANQSNSSPGSVIRTAVREFLDRRLPEDNP